MYPHLYPTSFSDIDDSTTCVKTVTCLATLSVRAPHYTYIGYVAHFYVTWQRTDNWTLGMVLLLVLTNMKQISYYLFSKKIINYEFIRHIMNYLIIHNICQWNKKLLWNDIRWRIEKFNHRFIRFRWLKSIEMWSKSSLVYFSLVTVRCRMLCLMIQWYASLFVNSPQYAKQWWDYSFLFVALVGPQSQ